MLSATTNQITEAPKNINGVAPAVPRRIVKWTPEEIEKVALASFELRLINPSMSYIEAVQQAQRNELPSTRQRPIRQEADFDKTVMPIWAALTAARAPGQQKDFDIATSDPRTDMPEGLLRVESETEEEIAARLRAASESVNAGTRAEVEAEKKVRKGTVRWDHDEQLLIARESKRLRGDFPDMSVLESIRKAVDYSMPAARQREIHHMGEVKWITELWQQIDAEERAAKAEQAAEEARQQAQAAQQAEAEAKHAEVDPLSLDFQTLIKAMGIKIGEQIVSAIGESLQDAIMKRIDEAILRAPTPIHLPEGVTRLHAAPRDRKPRVLVVGLLRQQAHEVEDSMRQTLNLDFVQVENSGGSAIEEKARNADLVVLMTKFISHKHQDAAKRANEHVVYRNGGVSELKRWLTSWINGEVLTAA